jgi:lipoprotein signal peptidase
MRICHHHRHRDLRSGSDHEAGIVHGMNLIERGEIEVLPPFLTFRMAWNRGINFGLFSQSGRFHALGADRHRAGDLGLGLDLDRAKATRQLGQISAGLLLAARWAM